ncbi:MAG: hypothetical protein WC107_07090 [Patescibacteria group bacterium]
MPEIKEPKKDAKKEGDIIAKFEWASPESFDRERNPLWYAVVIIAVMAVAGVLAWQKIWTGVALVGVACIYLLLSKLRTRKVKCMIFDRGIVVDGRSYDFDDFKSFWFVEGEILKVRFQPVNKFGIQVTMPLMNADPDEIREFLLTKLPEENSRGEDAVDMINRILKF